MNQLPERRKLRVALVTGASGFVGGHVCARLCREPVEVRALIRNRTAAQSLEINGARLVEGDIRNPQSLANAMDGVDTVFHCAAIRDCGDTGTLFDAVNVAGTRHVLDACRKFGIEHVVHVSTVSVLGAIRYGETAGEDREPHPTSIYGATKLAAEVIARDAGVPVVIARPM